MKIKPTLILLVVWFSVFIASEAEAGFGISPPRVWNDYLVPGSHFEQSITLTRSNPDNPIEIIIEIEAPEIKNWIKIDKGERFVYPAGSQQFPITVIIDVPEDAGYSIYYGKMNIKTAPIEGEGQVAIALGAVVDFKLKVSGEKFSDFKSRGVSIPDFEEGWPLKFVVSLENLGNVKVRPSRVHLEIFDDYHQTKLQTGDIVQMSWVESFKVGNSQGEIAVDLKTGTYWAEYEVYKNDEMILKEKLRFSVVPPGTLKPPPLWNRIKNFITASPLRIIIFTFIGTIILVCIILGGMKILKKTRKNKKKKGTNNSKRVRAKAKSARKNLE